MAHIIKIPVILAFPSLFQKSSAGEGKPSYNMKGIIDPSDEKTVSICEAAIIKVAEEEWGTKAKRIMEGFVRTGKKPDVFFVKDEYRSQEGNTYAGFEDMYYVTAKTQPDGERPTVVDRSGKLVDEDSGLIYSGCRGIAHLDIWPQDNKWGKAVRATPIGFQFVGHGKKFSGGAAPAKLDSFENLGDLGEDEDEDVNSLA